MQFGELKAKLRNIVLVRRKNGQGTLKNGEYRAMRRTVMVRTLAAYEREAADLAASQPSIISVLLQNGLDNDHAQVFTASEQARVAIADARSRALDRGRRRASQNASVAVRKISTVFDLDDEEGEEIDLDSNSTDSTAIVQQFMSNATHNENFDEDATADISHMVACMMRENKEDWEI